MRCTLKCALLAELTYNNLLLRHFQLSIFPSVIRVNWYFQAKPTDRETTSKREESEEMLAHFAGYLKYCIALTCDPSGNRPLQLRECEGSAALWLFLPVYLLVVRF